MEFKVIRFNDNRRLIITEEPLRINSECRLTSYLDLFPKGYLLEMNCSVEDFEKVLRNKIKLTKLIKEKCF
jgi:hypothetical protein